MKQYIKTEWPYWVMAIVVTIVVNIIPAFFP